MFNLKINRATLLINFNPVKLINLNSEGLGSRDATSFNSPKVNFGPLGLASPEKILLATLS